MEEHPYAYVSFGNYKGHAGELLNRILYTGQQYDQEMGKYYLRARYYNPDINMLHINEAKEEKEDNCKG